LELLKDFKTGRFPYLGLELTMSPKAKPVSGDNPFELKLFVLNLAGKSKNLGIYVLFATNG
jgi:hypothetical protein